MNFIEALFLRFYCLDLSKIVALLICATVIYHLLRKLFEKHVWWRSAVRVTFLLYCAVIITATVVSRECDIIEPSLMPFASYLEMKASGNVEIIRSNFMNVVLFYPAGLLLCESISKRVKPGIRVAASVLTGAVGSVVIEVIQYSFSLGKAETDDVIHNTLGMLLGAVFALIGVFGEREKGVEVTSKLSKAEKLFLTVIKGALCEKEPILYCDLTPEEWESALRISEEQKLYSMFVDVVAQTRSAESIPTLPKHKLAAVGEVTVQTVKTEELVKLVDRLQKAGLDPFVVKGAVCRAIYPKGDLRISSDEDIIVPPGEFANAAKVLCEYGMEPCGELDDKSFEIGFRKKGSPLYVELHSALFEEGSRAFGSFAGLFSGLEERLCDYEIDKNKSVRSLAPHDHMLYLILHAYKHFVHSGFGVRQAADIGVWSERYFESIDWEKLYHQCKKADVLVFAASVIELSRRYLGRGAFPSDKWKKLAQPPEPMLSDMLSGGVYGSKSRSRMHSASVTLGAVESTRQGKRSGGVKEALFPPRERLEGKYTVLKKHPWMLPAVWIVRLVGYAAELASGKGSRADDSMRIAQKRTALLKYYNVLK